MMDPWCIDGVRCTRGGALTVPAARAPLGRLLRYRRAKGEGPTSVADPPLADAVRSGRWMATIGHPRLGDLLLGLATVQALHEAGALLGFAPGRLWCAGPRRALVERSTLPVQRVEPEDAPLPGARDDSVICSGERPDTTRTFLQEHVPTFLDLGDDGSLHVHADLPMRLYLEVERRVGVRLPRDLRPCPLFLADGRPAGDRPTVALVTTSGWPGRRGYAERGFAKIMELLAGRWGPCRFQLVVPPGGRAPMAPSGDSSVEVLDIDATGCVDLFASCDLVVGNNTGLTHLAALTERREGGGPEVVGIYSRHPHLKWTTGRLRHHAVAGEFSQMVSAADACPAERMLHEPAWGPAGSIDAIAPETIADFAATAVEEAWGAR
ncbi:MAG: hypothetical protein U5K30_12840 [Acidimicrobiales bacterium]|nr:hypothetical protein [Acidimicrobiales bacterium]